jgi:ubiquinone/menaquinone biosynthesis C-methylase UbiE
MSTAKTWIKDSINSGLRPIGIQVVRGYSDAPGVESFISARKTVAAAQRSGLSVTDYIDRTYASPGATNATVAAILKLGDLHEPVSRVCEIGPGSGRFMEKIIDALHPATYEIYETATDWLARLRTVPGVQVNPCDGSSLAATATASVDLVHAQKVFVYIPMWTTASYLSEMARVARPGGIVAFDLVTEDCIDEETMAQWIEHTSFFRPVPRAWTIEYLARRGLTYLGNHMSPLPPGRAELLVFRRNTE